MKNKLICIIGPDGTGKSTQIRLLIAAFQKMSINYEYRWLRFHHFISIPLLAVARILGYSEVVILGSGKKIGYHHFHNNWSLCHLYPLFLFADTFIFTAIKIYIPMIIFKKCIICDRFTYDTLVDLMISTGNYSIYDSVIGKLFLSLIPPNSKIVMLITSEDFLRSRRDDVLFDKVLSLKIKLYLDIAKKFNIDIIDASLSIDKIHLELCKKLGHVSN
jgi:thymidylate kinase